MDKRIQVESQIYKYLGLSLKKCVALMIVINKKLWNKDSLTSVLNSSRVNFADKFTF